MNQNDPAYTNEIRAQLEEKGAAQVCTWMQSGNWLTHLTPIALEWLKEKDQEAERLNAASQAEMAAAASRAAVAAERAASAAEEQASASAKQALAADEQARASERQALAAERANTRATIALVIAAISLIATIFGLLSQLHSASSAPPSGPHAALEAYRAPS